ncbi:MAG: TauD/TfdA family dioxygenase [Parvibaculum sp.]
MSMTEGFRTFLEQTLHYFDRPHEAAATKAVDLPAAWVGRDMPNLTDMAYVLSTDEIAELDAALAFARKTGKESIDMLAADFPLPRLERKIARWREELKNGVGLQLVRGVPVERWSEDDASLFFWCLGLHLGRPGGQNPQEDLLGHVRNTNANKADPMVRLYQTAANIDYHCDAADVVGLLCLKKAKTGGKSRIVSSVSVFNRLLGERPELAARLFEPFYLDSRNETKRGAIGAIPITPCCYADGVLRTFYHSDYFRSAVRHEAVPAFTPLEQACLDRYEEIASDPALYLDMDLQPGDIQLLSNHTNLHARTEYEDFEEPAERRHLLRLWLSL